VKAVQEEPGRLWRKGLLKQTNFKSRAKGRGSDRYGESESGDEDPGTVDSAFADSSVCL